MSFEVTVTPTVYNVEVEVNPSVQPFDVQVITQQDLADLVDEAKQYAEDAEDSADSASASASSASASASASASSANSASASASSASGSANTATTQAGIATTQAGIATTQAGIATTKAQEASQSASDALASEQASAQSASDALQSEQNALASEQASALSEANALASEQSASASASTATAQAGIATTQAGIATTQAGNALTSANNALNSANNAAASAASAAQVGTSTLLTGFATGSNTTIAGTDTILQAFQKAQGQINARVSGTGVAGQVAFWSGTGSQTGDNELFWDNTNKRLGIGTNVPNSRINALDGTVSEFKFNSGAANLTPTLAVGNTGATGKFASLLAGTIGSSFVFDNSGFFSIGSDTKANYSSNQLGVGTTLFRIQSNGNVLINTTTDAGFRLDVNGTARVQGALTTNLTAGRVPFIGTGGVLSDDAGLVWNNTNKSLSINAYQSNSALAININDSNTTALASGTQYFARVINSNLTDNNWAMLHVQNANSSVAFSCAIGFQFVDRANNYGDIAFFTRGASGQGERLRIKDNRVGILNASPTTTLDVGGTGRITSTLKVGAATATNASSVLDIESTTAGFLPPRMTSTERNAIATPATGLVVYNTTDNRLSVYNGTAWVNLATV